MLTLHTSSEEENFLIFENLLKTSGTTAKVLSCLKMCFTTSCESIVPRFPPHPRDCSLNPLEETPLQPVLKSFITVFNIMRGYKINKSSVLGLAKSMYYITMLSQRWCLCGLVWFLPLPCSKIWNCAQDDIKFKCIVLWYLTQYI